jgi:hypothetical protein
MLRYAVLGLIGLVTGSAWAQQPAPPEAPTAVQSSNPVVPMEEPLPGDHWTYEVRDEITGTITATRTNVVTEVTPTEITVRFKIVGRSNEGFLVYDRSWNLLNSGSWKYSPNDGSGIRTPLTTGKTWAFQSNDVNAVNANNWKRSGNSKVVGQESVTTKAGTFETFKIETIYSTRNIDDPTRKDDVTSQIWYAPAIDHWVKRTFISRVDKHLRANNTIELVEYGRKH